MISLRAITEKNWFKVLNLEVTPSQSHFVSPPINILARAYVYRHNKAEALAIYNNETMVGICLICELNNDLDTYELQQFMIDHNYQGMGYGKEALKLIIAKLRNDGKYPIIETCVHRDDVIALEVYNSLGFVDTKLRDRQVPESLLLRYYINKNDL